MLLCDSAFHVDESGGPRSPDEPVSAAGDVSEHQPKAGLAVAAVVCRRLMRRSPIEALVVVNHAAGKTVAAEKYY